jgi:hypothetical protein
VCVCRWVCVGGGGVSVIVCVKKLYSVCVCVKCLKQYVLKVCQCVLMYMCVCVCVCVCLAFLILLLIIFVYL